MYEVHAEGRVAIDALDYEYSQDARKQSPRRTEARLQLAVGQRGLGPREQERKQRTQRASFVASYHTRVHTEQQLIVLGSDALLKKIPRVAPRHVSSRPDYSWMLESRAEQSALRAAPDIATVVDVGMKCLSPKT